MADAGFDDILIAYPLIGAQKMERLAMDPHRDGGHGHAVGMPQVKVARLSEEHGVLEFAPGLAGLHVGARLEIVPNHVCPAVNLFDRMYGVRNGQVVCEIPIEGRGKNT